MFFCFLFFVLFCDLEMYYSNWTMCAFYLYCNLQRTDAFFFFLIRRLCALFVHCNLQSSCLAFTIRQIVLEFNMCEFTINSVPKGERLFGEYADDATQ